MNATNIFKKSIENLKHLLYGKLRVFSFGFGCSLEMYTFIDILSPWCTLNVKAFCSSNLQAFVFIYKFDLQYNFPYSRDLS
jgi:hypothetical protein